MEKEKTLMSLMYGCRKDGYWPLDEENLKNLKL